MVRLFSPFRRSVGCKGSIRVNKLQGAEGEGVLSQDCPNSRVSTSIHAADSHQEPGMNQERGDGRKGVLGDKEGRVQVGQPCRSPS